MLVNKYRLVFVRHNYVIIILCYYYTYPICFFIGLATRLCDESSGEWNDPDVRNCSQFAPVEENVSS